MTALNVLPYFHNFFLSGYPFCGGGRIKCDFHLKKQNVTINVKFFFFLRECKDGYKDA